MKTEKSHAELKIQFTSLIFMLLFLVFSTLTFAAGTKQYKFTNNENVNATDIHIEFDGNVDFHTTGAGTDPTVEVPAGTFADGSDNGGTSPAKINLASGFTGTGVAPGGNIVITLDFTGSDAPKVKSWYWTKSNNLNPAMVEADTLGRPKTPIKRCYDYSHVSFPSTGDGQILLTIAGTNYPFNYPPGLTGSQMANQMVVYINSLPFGLASLSAPAIVSAGSASLSGDNAVDFNSTIVQQDATLIVTDEDCTFADTIPTLPEWGLIFLGVLFLSIGILYLKKIF